MSKKNKKDLVRSINKKSAEMNEKILESGKVKLPSGEKIKFKDLKSSITFAYNSEFIEKSTGFNGESVLEIVNVNPIAQASIMHKLSGITSTLVDFADADFIDLLFESDMDSYVGQFMRNSNLPLLIKGKRKEIKKAMKDNKQDMFIISIKDILIYKNNLDILEKPFPVNLLIAVLPSKKKLRKMLPENVSIYQGIVDMLDLAIKNLSITSIILDPYYYPNIFGEDVGVCLNNHPKCKNISYATSSTDCFIEMKALYLKVFSMQSVASNVLTNTSPVVKSPATISVDK